MISLHCMNSHPDIAPKATVHHPVSVDEFVHPARTKSGSDSIDYGNASIDIADELRFALTGVSAFFEKNDLGLLQQVSI